jgi:organic hydroperoxide reductase OsmC/OhrA
MLDFPHHYAVAASAGNEGDVELTSPRLTPLRSASPAEFDGPGDRWSPETLLVGAVADCFILTFRAVARASRLSWTSIRCDVTGTLDRVDRTTQFTDIRIHASLAVPADVDPGAARRALEKSERSCLVTNSLKAGVHLDLEVERQADIVPALA